MKLWLLPALGLALGAAVPARSAVITLDSIDDLAGTYQFNYHGTLGPDEGAVSGSKLVIFDFAGYVDGSIFTPGADILGAVEWLTSTPYISPGFTDDPSLPNLVFTYVGSAFQNSGGPYAPYDITGFGARSTYGASAHGAFTTFTVKNNPPSTAGTDLITLGVTDIPAVPEPHTWAMLVMGFGLLGGVMRREKRIARVLA